MHKDHMSDTAHIKADTRFKQAERLKKRKDFDRVFEGRVVFRGKNFNAYVLPNALKFSRLGIMLSKKVGGAVARNRIKRLLRECFRLNKALLGPGLDVVLLPRRGFPNTYEAAETEFKRFAGWCSARRPK